MDFCLSHTFLGALRCGADHVMGKYSDKLYFPFLEQGSGTVLVCVKIFGILNKTNTQCGVRIVVTLILKKV